MLAQFLAPVAAYSAVYMSTLAALATALYFAMVASEAHMSARMALFVAGCASADPTPTPIPERARVVAPILATIAASARHERMIVRPDPDQCIRYEARVAKDGRGYVVALVPGERASVVQWTRKGAINEARALAALLNA